VGGLAFLVPISKFWIAAKQDKEESTIIRNSLSRKIFFVSLAYLPTLMLLMALDKA
jgi:hypothetical protein